MSSQDRTSEFFSICQSLPPGISSNALPTNNATGRYSDTNDPVTRELKAFHTTASSISKDIHGTSALLTELTSLIHSNSGSLFMDESERVNQLVLVIKSNIEGLNSKLDDANKVIQAQKRSLGRNSQAGLESSNLLGQLKEEYMNTAKGFKDVLKVRSERIKEKSDRTNEFLGTKDSLLGNGDSSALLGNKPRVYEDSSLDLGKEGLNGATSGLSLSGPGSLMDGPRLDLTSAMMNQQDYSQSSMPGGESSTQLPRPYGIIGNDNISSPNGMRNRNKPSSPTVYTPLDIQQMEEQSGQSQMMQLIPDQNYLRERADAMSAVESNIVELGTIFNKLAVMVNEHQDMVQRVEDNVDNASENITLSLATLTDTLTNLRTNKALFLKVFSVLIVFIIFFITFFA